MTHSVSSCLLSLAILATACTSGGADLDDAGSARAIPDLVSSESVDYGDAPIVPDRPNPELTQLLTELRASLSLGLSAVTIGFSEEQLDRVVSVGDARALWPLADLLRFPSEGNVGAPQIVAAFEALADVALPPTNVWGEATNRLIAWDLPAPEGYLEFKRTLFTLIEPQWEPLFSDDAIIDWRFVGWGGVLIDDRPVGDGSSCSRGCIPALDDPAHTDATGGDWYPDDRLIFGVEVDGESRAYPKNIMEVHEMVNDTIGGRRVAIPYCTLCGSAQAYLTDELPPGTIPASAGTGETRPIMRTSGLLFRSNKMMYEFNTKSFVDTFLGVATSGPLLAADVTFDQVSVVVSTWGQWKRDHPDTTIVAEDGGIGRSYPLDPLRGRDDDGPIFPIGEQDERLPVQEPVLGVTTSDGTPVAVHVAIARATLEAGESIVISSPEFDSITIELDGDGIRALTQQGEDAGAHQAFWFAWSQFQPGTLVWPADF